MPIKLSALSIAPKGDEIRVTAQEFTGLSLDVVSARQVWDKVGFCSLKLSDIPVQQLSCTFVVSADEGISVQISQAGHCHLNLILEYLVSSWHINCVAEQLMMKKRMQSSPHAGQTRGVQGFSFPDAHTVAAHRERLSHGGQH